MGASGTSLAGGHWPTIAGAPYPASGMRSIRIGPLVGAPLEKVP
jgi:hypothetical protein